MKYEEIIKTLERRIEAIMDVYLKEEGHSGFYDNYLNTYEVEAALDKIYDRNSFYYETCRIGNYTILCIDDLLIDLRYNKTTKVVAETINTIPLRRAEKILNYLENTARNTEIMVGEKIV